MISYCHLVELPRRYLIQRKVVKTKNEKKELYSRLGTQRNRSKKKTDNHIAFSYAMSPLFKLLPNICNIFKCPPVLSARISVESGYSKIRRGLPSPWAASSQSEFRWRIRYEQPGTRSETRTTTSTRFSQLVVLTRKPASFWLENVIAVVILLLGWFSNRTGNVSWRRQNARKGLNTTSGAQFAVVPLVKPVV